MARCWTHLWSGPRTCFLGGHQERVGGGVVVKKGQEGSRRAKKGQEGSRRGQEGGPRRVKKGQEGPRRVKKGQEEPRRARVWGVPLYYHATVLQGHNTMYTVSTGTTISTTYQLLIHR